MIAVTSVLLLLASCAIVPPPGPPILQSDFESDPVASGWSSARYRGMESQSDWVESGSAEHGKCLAAKRAYWQTPEFAVEPFQYYQVTFSYKCASKPFWTATSTDAAGSQLADNDSSLDSAPNWTQASLCFRAMAGAARARVRLRAPGSDPLYLDDFALRPIDNRLAALWADSILMELPPVQFKPPPDRFELLPHTFAKLKRRELITIVLLGDSIMNDTGNSALDALLERQYRGATIKLVNSVRGSTGCQYYRRADRVQQYVLDYDPDLLIIGGISHGYETGPIRDVIRQVRAQSQCEILVLTGAVASLEARLENYLESNRVTREEALEVFDAFPVQLAAMAREEKVAFFDTGSAWDVYVAASGKPPAWFHRDSIHANDRGKQVLGRLLLRYLSLR